MELEEGKIVITKKNHACGGNRWQIVRLGADVKLKCLTCGHCIFVSRDDVKKISKGIEDGR